MRCKNKIFAGERTRYSLVKVTPVWVSCLRYFCVAWKPTLEQQQRKCLFKTRLLSRSEVLRSCSKSITSVRLANHPTWLESRENSPFAFVCVCVCVDVIPFLESKLRACIADNSGLCYSPAGKAMFPQLFSSMRRKQLSQTHPKRGNQYKRYWTRG